MDIYDSNPRNTIITKVYETFLCHYHDKKPLPIKSGLNTVIAKITANITKLVISPLKARRKIAICGLQEQQHLPVDDKDKKRIYDVSSGSKIKGSRHH